MFLSFLNKYKSTRKTKALLEFTLTTDLFNESLFNV